MSMVLIWFSVILSLNKPEECCNSIAFNNFEAIRQSVPNLPKELFPMDSSFQIYWNEFRESIMNRDTNALLSLVNFPLITHGFLDEHPQFLINESKFFPIMDLFLEGEIYLHRDTTSFDNWGHHPSVYIENIDYIKTTLSIDKCEQCLVSELWVRMGDMEFEMIDGNWKLLGIYVDSFLVWEIVKEP